ncbi:MAG: FHA domain-containing protein [Deltaproteobacteria bacterium]|nr:MAG: FHA domain-containing protein [Deltaproteobacteria bacterium]
MEIVVKDRTGAERVHPVAAGCPVVVGRDPASDIVLDDLDVSRRHAVFELRDGGCVVFDQSSNGTFVGPTHVRHASLIAPFGTPIRIGPFELSARAAAPGHTPAHGTPPPAAAPQPVAPPRAVEVSADLRRAIRRKLLDSLDLAEIDRDAIGDAAMRPRVVEALGFIIDGLASELPAGVDRTALIEEMADEALGLGPLESLLADDAVSEIMVVDPETIYCERGGKIERTNLRFTDNDAARAVIERIVTPLGRRIDEASPYVDARLPDGSRVNAVIPPLALRGACITIRKFSKRTLGMDDLVGFGAMSPQMARFLSRCVRARANIVISGGTGSGKTTLLNALSAEIPADERIVTIEDAAELKLVQPHVVGLEARPPNMEGRGAVTIRDLVRNALRMRPDRIIVGECRGGEAIDMLQAMNTGHDGSMTTTHANSPRDAIARLETLALMSGIDLPARAIREQIASAVDVIVQQTRLGDGSRKVTAISEIVGIDDDGAVEYRNLFEFVRTGTGDGGAVLGEHRATGYLPGLLPRFIRLGLVRDGAYL